MARRDPNQMLFIIFIKMEVDDELDSRLNDARKRPWTAPKDAQSGDTALFYFGGLNPGIHAIGRTKTSAQEGVPGDWTESERGFFAQYADIANLRQPVLLQQIRKEFPEWKRWNNLRGVRVNIVPVDFQGHLATMIVKENPSARTLLSPWLGLAESHEPNLEPPDRPLVSVRRRLRSSGFGRLVRSKSRGQCGVCSSLTNYDKLGILEAAHIRSVEHKGVDELSNALALCPNHHALFDEGKWTLDGQKVILAPGLPEKIRKTFGRQIRCNWEISQREVEWHRKTVFKRKVHDG